MDLHLAERSKADNIRDRISTICHEQIMPALSKVCDKLTENKEQLFLDKLELDLGTIREDELEQVLVRKLVDRFEEQVKELILMSAVEERTGSTTGRKEKNGDAANRTRVDVLMHFFRMGTIPWWCPDREADIAGWIEEQFSEDAESLTSAVGQELGSPAVRARLIRYFTDTQFQRFFDIHKLTDVFRFYTSFRQVVRSGGMQLSRSWEEFRKFFLDVVLDQMGRGGSALSTPASSVLPRLSITQKQRAVVGAVSLLVDKYDLPQEIIEELFSKRSEGIALFPNGQWEQAFNTVDPPAEIPPGEKAKSRPLKSDTQAEFPAARKEDQFVEISNAGLVLVWPYLNTLFEHLDFVEERAFVSVPATHRAVHLLHFISTGHEEGEEHEWPLNKLLCGLEPETLVPEDIELSDREKNEAEAMVKSAVDRWKALKNTSVGGFRETFLQRQGILMTDPHGWKVEIERITYDILLDKLPWPISVIKLPWNEEIIHVQW
ncbi:contractile injection system tape measure protein [Fodinibius sediminis]|uniref:Uncharacterized protein n=1 Tax=Fodinibius sediminis TaxID=1214077 RepID=A0A521DJA0_9BACT|nr:contractile injection system tape measure protein [Fodinibius sediminis]SMO71777.1 hypothetical protein SAMN06265218_110123 [Fodinibius sediminis]